MDRRLAAPRLSDAIAALMNEDDDVFDTLVRLEVNTLVLEQPTEAERAAWEHASMLMGD